MDITYPLLIQEDIAQLQAAERAARDKTRADRGFGFSRRGGSRASVRPRRSWAIVCEPFSAGGSAIAKTAWQGAGAAARHGGTHHAGSVGRLASGDAGHRREAQVYLRDT